MAVGVKGVRRGSIQSRILVWVIGLTTLVAAVIGAGSYLIMSRQLFSNQKVLLHVAALSVAKDTEHLLESLSGDLRLLVDGDVVRIALLTSSTDSLQQELAKFEKSFPALSYIPPGEGDIYQVLHGRLIFVSFDPSRHPAYSRALGNPGQIVLSAPYDSELLGEKCIDFFLNRVDDQGISLGIFRGTVPVARFEPRIVDTLSAVHGAVDIVDRENLVVQSSDDDDVENLKDEETGTNYFESADNPELKKDIQKGIVFGEYRVKGERSFLAAENIRSYGWKVIVGLPRDAFLAPLEALRNLVLVITGMAMLLASAGAYAIGHSVASPIAALTRVTVRIAEGGDLAERVAVTSGDEVGQLGSAFNRMLDRLSEARSTLQGRNRALQRTNAELDQFAYVVSHDLKAPLRAIANLSLWIEEDLGETLEGENRRQMELLRGRVRRMEDLINGILEYSRIGRVAVEAEKVEVAPLLGEIVDSLCVPENFKVSIGKGMPSLTAPKVRLGQVFANLISNAVKYSDKEEGTVDVSVTDRGEFYVFAVADNGPGIAPQFHEKIFQIFQTLQARDTYESTGVGLTLVKKIVEEQGGEVWVESEEGKGATFSFSWPKTPLQRKAA